MASPRMDLSYPPEDITHESATTQKDLVKHKKTVHKILNLRISHSAGQSLQRLRPFLFCCATHLTSSFCKNVSITVSQLLVQVALTMRAGQGTGGYWCLVCEMEPYGPPPPPTKPTVRACGAHAVHSALKSAFQVQCACAQQERSQECTGECTSALQCKHCAHASHCATPPGLIVQGLCANCGRAHK